MSNSGFTIYPSVHMRAQNGYSTLAGVSRLRGPSDTDNMPVHNTSLDKHAHSLVITHNEKTGVLHIGIYGRGDRLLAAAYQGQLPDAISAIVSAEAGGVSTEETTLDRNGRRFSGAFYGYDIPLPKGAAGEAFRQQLVADIGAHTKLEKNATGEGLIQYSMPLDRLPPDAINMLQDSMEGVAQKFLYHRREKTTEQIGEFTENHKQVVGQEDVVQLALSLAGKGGKSIDLGLAPNPKSAPKQQPEQQPETQDEPPAQPKTPKKELAPAPKTEKSAPSQPPVRLPEQTHYAALGLTPDAAETDITRAYRTKAWGLMSQAEKTDHAGSLAELHEAYRVLSNPDSREAYDGILQAQTDFKGKARKEAIRQKASEFEDKFGFPPWGSGGRTQSASDDAKKVDEQAQSQGQGQGQGEAQETPEESPTLEVLEEAMATSYRRMKRFVAYEARGGSPAVMPHASILTKNPVSAMAYIGFMTAKNPGWIDEMEQSGSMGQRRLARHLRSFQEKSDALAEAADIKQEGNKNAAFARKTEEATPAKETQPETPSTEETAEKLNQQIQGSGYSFEGVNQMLSLVGHGGQVWALAKADISLAQKAVQQFGRGDVLGGIQSLVSLSQTLEKTGKLAEKFSAGLDKVFGPERVEEAKKQTPKPAAEENDEKKTSEKPSAEKSSAEKSGATKTPTEKSGKEQAEHQETADTLNEALKGGDYQFQAAKDAFSLVGQGGQVWALGTQQIGLAQKAAGQLSSGDLAGGAQSLLTMYQQVEKATKLVAKFSAGLDKLINPAAAAAGAAAAVTQSDATPEAEEKQASQEQAPKPAPRQGMGLYQRGFVKALKSAQAPLDPQQAQESGQEEDGQEKPKPRSVAPAAGFSKSWKDRKADAQQQKGAATTQETDEKPDAKALEIANQALSGTGGQFALVTEGLSLVAEGLGTYALAGRAMNHGMGFIRHAGKGNLGGMASSLQGVAALLPTIDKKLGILSGKWAKLATGMAKQSGQGGGAGDAAEEAATQATKTVVGEVAGNAAATAATMLTGGAAAPAAGLIKAGVGLLAGEAAGKAKEAVTGKNDSSDHSGQSSKGQSDARGLKREVNQEKQSSAPAKTQGQEHEEETGKQSSKDAQRAAARSQARNARVMKKAAAHASTQDGPEDDAEKKNAIAKTTNQVRRVKLRRSNEKEKDEHHGSDDHSQENAQKQQEQAARMQEQMQAARRASRAAKYIVGAGVAAAALATAAEAFRGKGEKDEDHGPAITTGKERTASSRMGKWLGSLWTKDTGWEEGQWQKSSWKGGSWQKSEWKGGQWHGGQWGGGQWGEGKWANGQSYGKPAGDLRVSAGHGDASDEKSGRGNLSAEAMEQIKKLGGGLKGVNQAPGAAETSHAAQEAAKGGRSGQQLG